jgi:hypothetical protein
LRILPASTSAKYQGRWSTSFGLRGAEGTRRPRMPHDRLAASLGRTTGIARSEDEEGNEAEQDRGREDDCRASPPRIKRPVEQEAKAVDHRAAARSSAPPTPGGWA